MLSSNRIPYSDVRPGLMTEPRDRIEIEGLERSAEIPRSGAGAEDSNQRFIMVWFRCCHQYGRLSRNAAATRYEGRCPRCGSNVSAGIGPGGSTRRIFEAR